MPDHPTMPGGGPSPPAASQQLARSAGVIGAATMTSRVLGLIRDQVLVFLFGAGDHIDSYNIAFRIPNLVRDLFAEGAMSAAFVPRFTRTLTNEGRERAWRPGNLVVNALLLATGLIVAAGMAFALPITTAFAGAYAEVPGKLELTTSLTRIMFPFLALVAVATALMGMLGRDGLSPDLFSHIDLFYYHAGAAAGRIRQPAGQIGSSGHGSGTVPAGIKPFPGQLISADSLDQRGRGLFVSGKAHVAIHVLENAKVHIAKQLSPKHAAGCCYNLGMAYRRTGRHADALRQFTEVGDIYPMSMFARLAEKARNATLQEAGMGTFPQKKENDAH